MTEHQGRLMGFYELRIYANDYIFEILQIYFCIQLLLQNLFSFHIYCMQGLGHIVHNFGTISYS